MYKGGSRLGELPRLLVVALQLVLLLGLAQAFHLESFAFRKLLAVTAAGFVIHHLLPMTLRLPFFVLLSLGSLVLVVGPVHSVRLVGVGLALIGVCHLPSRFGWRLLILGIAAAALVLGRAGAEIPLPGRGVIDSVLHGYDAVWPILGSMFMFRLIVYLYDLRHRSAPFGVWRSLAYFFMLPNVCFPMYPIVDYQTFNRNYFDESPWRIYQIGIKWTFRGMIHLLLYRLVAQHLTVPADQVADASGLARYMLTTFFLYLQISGQFHVVVGMLHLFGFNLPETHHLYYLSSSFTDFWRRINIYWKDFVLKVFFNPVYFRCRGAGPAAAMAAATLVTFFFTWLLHSYQWFWIRGSYPILWQDIVFWGGLSVLVLVNALYEQRYGRSRRIRGKRLSPGARMALGLQTIGTFCAIVTLWCLWTFQGSFRDWLSFMGNFGRIDLASAAVIVAGLVGIGAVSALLADVGREYSAGLKAGRQHRESQAPFPFWRHAAVTTILILPVFLVGGRPLLAAYRIHIPLPLTSTQTDFVASLGEELSDQDRQQQDRGYYEDLTNTRNYNLALWELYRRKPGALEVFEGTAIARRVPDRFHRLELVPSTQIVFRSAPISTNRWGFRDRDYQRRKPHGVYRVVLFGACGMMGWGVADDQTYENIVEDRINREWVGRMYDRVEILNFGVGGYGEFQKLWAFERSLEFEPDMVVWEIHGTTLTWLADHLAQVIAADVPIPYPELDTRLQREGLSAQSGALEIRGKLRRMAPQLLTWVLQRVQHECDVRGIELQALVPPLGQPTPINKTDLAQLIELVHRAGLPILDLTGAFRSQPDYSKLQVAPWDGHPNTEAHRLLADELYQQLRASALWRDVLGMDQPSQAAQRPPDRAAAGS